MLKFTSVPSAHLCSDGTLILALMAQGQVETFRVGKFVDKDEGECVKHQTLNGLYSRLSSQGFFQMHDVENFAQWSSGRWREEHPT
jgi:hypothetical protein